jgi:hypothetical protein
LSGKSVTYQKETGSFLREVTLKFGTEGDATSSLGDGWAQPEAGETWTVGPLSGIELPTPSKPGSYLLVLQLRPHVANGKLPEQRLIVRASGETVGEFRLARRSTRACTIPWRLIAGRPRLSLTLEMPDAARPADVVGGTDTRALGVALTRLSLYRDDFETWRTDHFLEHDEPTPVDVAAIMAADRVPLDRIMMEFESLGQNCEFGLVQRACNAEPLGLLRFSSTPLPQLLAALEARFEGMGDPDKVRVEISSNGREFMVNDTRFGMVYHAWVKTGEMEPEAVHRREVRRVPFLVRKLVEDLEMADKTFVFKGMGAMAEEEVFPLVAAIRRYGPNTLLFVTLADGEHRGGTVEVRAPGFFVGYLDRFAPGGDAHEFLLGQWVKICREAYRLRLARSAQAA